MKTQGSPTDNSHFLSQTATALLPHSAHTHTHTHLCIGHNWCAVTIVTFPRHYELNIGDVPVGGRALWFAPELLFFSEYTRECAIISHFPLESICNQKDQHSST